MLADLFRFLRHFWARAILACDLPFDTNYSNCGQIQFPSGWQESCERNASRHFSEEENPALAGWYQHAWNKRTIFNLTCTAFFGRAHSHQYHILEIAKVFALYTRSPLAGIDKNSQIPWKLCFDCTFKTTHYENIQVFSFPNFCHDLLRSIEFERSSTCVHRSAPVNVD